MTQRDESVMRKKEEATEFNTGIEAEAENICAREERELKKLNSRINRIIGQLKGIQNMIDDNRYCGDILIQIGAVESALQALGYLILQEHMESCVVEEVRRGNTAIMSEAVELMKKLK